MKQPIFPICMSMFARQLHHTHSTVIHLSPLVLREQYKPQPLLLLLRPASATIARLSAMPAVFATYTNKHIQSPPLSSQLEISASHRHSFSSSSKSPPPPFPPIPHTSIKSHTHQSKALAFKPLGNLRLVSSLLLPLPPHPHPTLPHTIKSPCFQATWKSRPCDVP
jgi:hypothetical protein